MRRKQRQEVAPRHTSEQRYAPELHEQLNEALNAEAGPPDKEPTIPMPRYELIHRPAETEKRLPEFTLLYHARSPSAALHIAGLIAEKLDIVCDFHDKHTDHWTFMSHLKMDED